MTTEKQIAANRRNALRSTGPVTPEGKARAAAAPLKSGMYAKSIIIPSEKAVDFDQLVAEYYQRYRPVSPDARALLDEVIFCDWTLRRLRVCEGQLWQDSHSKVYESDRDAKLLLGQGFNYGDQTSTRLQYRLDATRRAFFRLREALKKQLAEDAALSAPSPEIGTFRHPDEPPRPSSPDLQPRLHPANAAPLPSPGSRPPTPDPASAASPAPDPASGSEHGAPRPSPGPRPPAPDPASAASTVRPARAPAPDPRPLTPACETSTVRPARAPAPTPGP